MLLLGLVISEHGYQIYIQIVNRKTYFWISWIKSYYESWDTTLPILIYHISKNKWHSKIIS
jgi:hypothetical protein